MVVDMGLELSQRVAAIAPSVTLAIDAKAKKLRAEGKNVIGFGAGEPDFPTPEYICAAAKDAIDQGMTRYTPVPVTLALREEICKKLLRDNALSYKPENIVVSNGAKQSLFNALSAILNPGDEVLIPSPCWVSYPEMVRMAWGEPVYVKTREEEEFLPTAAALEAAITPKTKALILNSPNNPNGCVYPEKLLREIADLAVKHGFYVISDEIYEKLIYDGQKHVSIASLGEAIREQTIVVNGVSKSYAMTGWRIGYAAAPAKIAKAMSSFQSHSTSNANSIAQHAAAVAMTNDTKVVWLEHDALFAWLDEHPRVAVDMLQVLAHRMRDNNERISELVFMDVPGRLAKTLLNLASRFGEPVEAGLKVPHNLTQEEMAQLVGSSRETVNKALMDFANRGWIAREGRSIIIYQPGMLIRRSRR